MSVYERLFYAVLFAITVLSIPAIAEAIVERSDEGRATAGE